MSKETFAFTSSTLRSLRLQREWLDWEDRRRAASRQSASRRYQPVARTLLSLPKPTRRPQYCRDPAVHNALYTGDLARIRSIFKDEATANLTVETLSEELVWSPEQGLWVLTPQKKHTSPLRITAARGYQDCVKHLLLQGAEVDAVVGGKAALHDSCANHRAECSRLLLSYSANPNILSEEGLAPLHLCTTQETLPCAHLLLEYGALVNQITRDRRVSPLHVAAKHGLDDHIQLYLCYGANINHRNREGETALNAACASADRPEEAGRYYRVVKRLLESGADVQVAGRKNHTPLHNACSNCHFRIVELLLQQGAEVNVSNCAGYTPVDCALQAVEDYLDGEPERVVALLLNHGAAPINPKMLKFCALSPLTMEIILNSYDRILSCDSWFESVSPEVWQEHQLFYDSAIGLVNQPRPLQHLARCAVRKQLGKRCHHGIAQLQLPSSLQDYLYLPLEGYLK
ncbi:ankyrin repeat and SOCS box protein 16 [Anolis carolinensis]|uniref:Ankyrin repeat and SOCS box containing 16 n=1 Tax=Anolis carolinensis TaxID=28377 RepID=G1KTL4_ANOCA|nr:PREDICTED: ankyrin repeat and SOCS box protein 16 [Anolis carolinensis]|eukprot:XP_016850034.1 PREDICTED: ankyrin repeat and SOCS box protein 16 [Anolis carolinensis]